MDKRSRRKFTKEFKAETVALIRQSGKSIAEVSAMSVKQAVAFFAAPKLTRQEEEIARLILKEIRERLGFLADVGLDYLTLDRVSASLS